ncbi:hypothetical protein SUGI_1055970 [Cryptomeria japonica]|nr:hypothetical protein SUGI_1055970 [Cryptomeria japonica]
MLIVVHGHDTTLPVTIGNMLLHCKAVAHGARRSLLVDDFPFGSYEKRTEQAVGTVIKTLKERGYGVL